LTVLDWINRLNAAKEKKRSTPPLAGQVHAYKTPHVTFSEKLKKCFPSIWDKFLAVD
jgi:hypothetical protein